ncbi:hypothetical protein ACFQBU_06280 [Jhaorihella thermophila]
MMPKVLQHSGHVLSQLGQEVAQAWSLLIEQYRNDRRLRIFARELVSANLLLIFLPAAVIWAGGAGLIAVPDTDFLHPGRDGSLPEMFNYAQTGLTAAFLFLAWRSGESLACLAWAALFVFVLLDDSLQYHEHMGEWLARVLALTDRDGLRAVDFGELLAWVLAAAVLLPLVAVSALRTAGRERGFAILIGAVFSALVFFGLAVDMLHQFTGLRALTLLEDGGEMLSIAAACILSFGWYRLGRANPGR